MEQIGSKYRHELKFLCGDGELLLLENKLRAVMRRDAHAGSGGTYRIRSLYFDTTDDACYRENLDGTDPRYKYRVRIYNGSDEVIRLEKKITAHGMKRKDSCLLTVQQCTALEEGSEIRGVSQDQELLGEFLTERRARLLQPRVIVEYVRTPYVYPVGNVRVTFDRDITSSPGHGLLREHLPTRPVLPPGTQVLEVKYDELLPGAIGEILQRGQDLRRISFSKYALCRRYGVQ